MGIPYSKQINYAFDQVTPLVAAGFEVLQTTKNISIFITAIQIFTLFVLILILMTLLALLLTVNPDLSKERQAIVTPVVKWFACWLMPECQARSHLKTLASIALVGTMFAGGCVMWAYSTDVQNPTGEGGTPIEGEVGVGDETDAGNDDGKK